jgi:hypothetical protein
VRDWLGHADLATTRVGLQHARKAFETHRESFAHEGEKAASTAGETTD